MWFAVMNSGTDVTNKVVAKGMQHDFTGLYIHALFLECT